MARYRIPEKSFIDNSIVEEGTIIEYNGKFPGSDWEKIEDPREAQRPAGNSQAQNPQRGR